LAIPGSSSETARFFGLGPLGPWKKSGIVQGDVAIFWHVFEVVSWKLEENNGSHCFRIYTTKKSIVVEEYNYRGY